jgi:hypothetical protein
MSDMSTAALAPLERLVAIKEIKLLRARYCRFIDMKLWDDLAQLLHKDIELDLRASSGTLVRGREAFLAHVRTRFAEGPSLHLNFLPEIQILSASRATAIWAQEAYLHTMWVKGERHAHAYGWSEDGYEKAGGRWQVRSVRLLRPWVI